MQSPISILIPADIYGEIKTPSEYPPGFTYRIAFAIPSLAFCELGSFFIQSITGKDYWIELWTFNVFKDGYININTSKPSVSFILFLKGNLSGKFFGNDFIHIPAKSFTIFYLPAGMQQMDLHKGEYVLLIILPPAYYFENMDEENSQMKKILSRLSPSKNESASLANLKMPYGAWRIVKRLEKTNKNGSALDIELRRYMLELLGLYFEQYKQHSSKPVLYSSTKEKAIAAKSYILENLGNTDLGGLYEMAIRFYVTPKPLTREFKLLTGKTIPEFIADERLSWAKTLLDKNELPVSEIAFIVGFSDAANFTRKFKKKHGYSPGKHRAFGNAHT